jgi:hypothetical protein
MGRAVNPEVRAAWQARLARQASSELSVADFCRQEGVSTASFYGWRQRLRRGRQPATRANDGTSVAAAAGKSGHRPAGEVRFIQIPLSSQRGAAAVELTLPDGTVVRVPTECGAALELVLGMLLNRPTIAEAKELVP